MQQEIDPSHTLIDESSIDQMILEVYGDVNKSLKIYSKKLILNALGITIDTWGHVSNISEALKDEILNIEEIQILKQNLLESIKQDLVLKLNAEMESKYYSKKAISQIASAVFTKLNKQILSEIEEIIHDELLASYSKSVQSSIYSLPQIQEIMIKKI